MAVTHSLRQDIPSAGNAQSVPSRLRHYMSDKAEGGLKERFLLSVGTSRSADRHIAGPVWMCHWPNLDQIFFPPAKNGTKRLGISPDGPALRC
jgi:hypothetical protein